MVIENLPKDWSIKKVSDICEKPQYGYTASASHEAMGPKFLRITDISAKGVDWLKVPYCQCSKSDFDKYKLYDKDILFARIGATTGKSFIVKNAPESVFASYLIRLRVNSDTSPDYLYYYFQSLFYWNQINANKDNNLKGGVNGSILSELEVILPLFPEQRKIAAILFKIQKAIGMQEKIIETTRELKKATMQHVFTYGLRGEKLKETEIGRMPESWEVEKIGKHCQKPEYGLTESAVVEKIGPKFLRISDITESGVDWDIVPYCHCPEGVFDKYELKNNDILFARIGATTGKSYIVKNPPRAVFASYLIRLRPLDDVVPDYLFYFFNSEEYWNQINANKSNNLKGGVNSSVLSCLSFSLPDKEEQKEIVEILIFVEQKVKFHSTKRSILQDLFKTMLNKLMTGEIRVNDLEIDVSEVA